MAISGAANAFPVMLKCDVPGFAGQKEQHVYALSLEGVSLMRTYTSNALGAYKQRPRRDHVNYCAAPHSQCAKTGNLVIISEEDEYGDMVRTFDLEKLTYREQFQSMIDVYDGTGACSVWSDTD